MPFMLLCLIVALLPSVAAAGVVPVWGMRVGDSARQIAVLLDADSADNVIVVSSAAGRLDFGGGALACAHLFDADTLMLLNPDHAKKVAESGWSKKDVRDYLFATCGVTEHELTAGGRSDIMPHYQEAWQTLGLKSGSKLPCVRAPERIKIIVAGEGPIKGTNISGIGCRDEAMQRGF